jgi:hypothetical protein
VLEADNLTAKCGNLNIPQLSRLPWPVTGIALLFYCMLQIKCRRVANVKMDLEEV